MPIFSRVREWWRGAKDSPPAPRLDPPPRRSTNPAQALNEALAHMRAMPGRDPISPATTWEPKSLKLPRAVPGVAPKVTMAADDQISSLYAGGAVTGYSWDGYGFMGYPLLAEMAQIPEYRKPCEILANEMCRKWIKFTSQGDEDKTDRIKELEGEFDRLNVQATFRHAFELDNFFGRGQIYIDLGTDGDELSKPLDINAKVGKGGLKAIRTVEPIWIYPSGYNSAQPLGKDFYRPSTWYVMGVPVHASRMLEFVSRPVPDMLKPAYMFGGVALTQLLRPYVDNWIRTRGSTSDITHNFSTPVLKTDMEKNIQPGQAAQLMTRINTFNSSRDNQGLMVLDKEREDFGNVSAPLAGLDRLQAQAQEQMAAIAGVPLVKLFGITPSGLNASSDGEVRVFYDTIESAQEREGSPNIRRLLDIVMMSLWGEIDKDIGFRWNPLWSQDEEKLAQIRKTDAETDCAYIDHGILDPLEVRTQLAAQEDSRYASIDVEDMPEPPTPESEPLEGGEEGEGLPDAELPHAGEKRGQAADNEFRESDHPRGQPGNAGQFGPGGGSAAASPARAPKKSPAERSEESGKLFVSNGKPQGGIALTYDPAKKAWSGEGVSAERVKKLAIPPGWSNVRLSPHEDDDLQVLATDSKGRTQYRYSEEYADGNKAQKFERVGRLMEKASEIETGTLAELAKGSDTAAAVRLMHLTGMRPSSDADTGAAKKAYGATTLLKSHVKVDGDTIHYDFIGKKGVRINNSVVDKALAAHVAKRLAKSDGDRLFATNEVKANALVKSLAGSEFKSKDLRTAVANRLATDAVAGTPSPANAKEKAAAIKRVGVVVSSQLGNTPSVALKDYINPTVFNVWLEG